MPCYTPEPTAAEIEQAAKQAHARGDWDSWYSYLSKRQIEAMLCDVIRDITNDHFERLQPDIKRVYQIHRRKERR